MGFYDPCFGEKKSLKVVYRFKNILHQVQVDDLAPLIAPLKCMLFFVSIINDVDNYSSFNRVKNFGLKELFRLLKKRPFLIKF